VKKGETAMEKYQIFISYRRDGGDTLAGRLADRFSALGYKVFYDVESLRSGTFNKQILDALAQCNDVLLVLPPNALDRCVNDDDWVRQELAFALKCKKNIIPIMMRGFEFPNNLPLDIENVKNMEGVTASNEYFDAVIEKIETMLNSSKMVQRKNIQPAPKIKIPLLLKTKPSTISGVVCERRIPEQLIYGHNKYIELSNCESFSDFLNITQEIKKYRANHNYSLEHSSFINPDKSLESLLYEYVNIFFYNSETNSQSFATYFIPGLKKLKIMLTSFIMIII